jgi:alpha-D-xyloside xylohydrolase
MFGPDVLISPVLHEGERQRYLYLPAGVDWVDAWTGQRQPGGQWITAEAPLEKVPVYFRSGTQPFSIS